MVAIHKGFPNEIFYDKLSNKRSTRCLWWIVLNVPHYKFYLYKVPYISTYTFPFSLNSCGCNLWLISIGWFFDEVNIFGWHPGTYLVWRISLFLRIFVIQYRIKFGHFIAHLVLLTFLQMKTVFIGVHYVSLNIHIYTIPHRIYIASIDARCFFFTFLNLKLSKLNKR